MRTFKSLKIGVILSLLFFLSQNLTASYILSDDGLIDPRVKEKINEIGSETKSKLGVNVYVHVKKTLDLDENISNKEKFKYIKNYEKKILPSMEKPYILLSMSVEDIYINLILTEDLKKIIDKDDILDDYVIPLLASKDKNTLFAKVSAAVINGYSAIVDSLVDNHNIKISSSNEEKINILSNDEIGNEGKTMSTIWRVLMYFLIITGLLAYTYAVLRKK